MERSYRQIVLLLVIAVAMVAIALVASDDAEAAQYGVQLRYNETQTEKVVKGLNPVTFNYTIKHTGDSLSEEVHIKYLDIPHLWQASFTTTTRQGTYTHTQLSKDTPPLEILLQRNEKVSLTSIVTSGLDQLNKTYPFTLNVWPKKEPGRNESFTTGVVIPQVARFEVAIWNPPPNGVYKAIPPSTVTIRFALYNLGNGIDRFLVQGESSRSQAGWTFKFENGVDEFGWSPNLTADPGRKNPHFIDVKIPIPAGERAGVTAQVTVNATSNFNQTKQMPPAFATVMALQYYNFEVFILGKDVKEGTPGEQTEFKIQINNLGNGWDTFTIKPLWDEELNPGFIASANPREAAIDTKTNQTIQYIVKVPTDAPKKTYFFNAEVTSSSTELAPVTKSFTVEVGQYFAIELDSPVPRMTTIPGGILDYEIVVRNTGNGLDTMEIDLTGVPPNWLFYITPPEASLLQDEEAKIQIRIIVPSSFDEATIGSYNLTVRADSVRSEAMALYDIQVAITQFYRIEWMYRDEPITYPEAPWAPTGIIKPRREFNPFEKNSIDIPLEVKNFGNGNDNITISGYSNDDRISVEVTPTYTLLLRDQTKYIKVSVEVPEDLPPGVYNLFINATSQDPEFEARVVPLDFEVFNLDAQVPPVPTFVDPGSGDVVRSELNVELKSNLSFKLKIENNGTKPITNVTIKVFDEYIKDGEAHSWNFFNFTTPPIAVGDRYIIGERPFKKDNPPLFWWSNVSGEHTLKFRIQYKYQSETTNDESTIKVLVEKKKVTSGGLTESTAFIGAIIAVVVAAVIVAGYVLVLRREPQVDADLYSSIYGADFDEGPSVEAEVPSEAADEPGLTPEQEVLYGDDYAAEDYDYDYGDEYADEYDYGDEYGEEEPQQ